MGGDGWLWLSGARTYRYQPSQLLGMKGVYARLKARQAKEAQQKAKAAAKKGQESSSESSTKDDSMEVDKCDGDTQDGKKTVENDMEAAKSESGDGDKKDGSESMACDQKGETGETGAESNEHSKKEEELSEKCEESIKENTDLPLENSVSGKDDDESSKENEIPQEKSTKVEDVEMEADKGEEKMDVDQDNQEVKAQEEKKEKKDEEEDDADTTKEERDKDGDDVEKEDRKSEGEEEMEEENIDVETVSPKPVFPMGSDQEDGVINVTKSLLHRTNYPKVSKPYSKLDQFLDRRLKVAENEQKARHQVEQLITKLKIQRGLIDSDKGVGNGKDNRTDSKLKLKPTSNGEVNADVKPVVGPDYKCFSPTCRTSSSFKCYSATCPKRGGSGANEVKLEKKEVDVVKIKEEKMDSEKPVSNGEVAADEEEEEEGKAGVKKESFQSSFMSFLNKTNTQTGTTTSTPTNTTLGKIPIPRLVSQASPLPTLIKGINTGSKTIVTSNVSGATSTTLSSSGKPLSNLVGASTLVKTITTGGSLVKTVTQSGTFAKALASLSLDELESRLPPQRTTKDPLSLPRFSRSLKAKARLPKKSALPVCQKFQTKSRKKSLFILEKYDLRSLARKQGKREAIGFNYNCKMNNVHWVYPCPRPQFKTGWRYRTQSINSLASAALQLRVLWACLRWDDLNIKPPQGGTNTVSTETEITTTELLKRRDIGAYGLRSEYLVRKIVVPIGLPAQPKGQS